MKDTLPIGGEAPVASQRGKPKPKITGKPSKRGAWGHQKSLQMHEKLAAKIDRKNERTKRRAEARAQRQARKHKALRGDQYLAA